jgi:hypothetical protein
VAVTNSASLLYQQLSNPNPNEIDLSLDMPRVCEILNMYMIYLQQNKKPIPIEILSYMHLYETYGEQQGPEQVHRAKTALRYVCDLELPSIVEDESAEIQSVH